MTFREIAQLYKDGPSGTDQVKLLYKAAQDLMLKDPENAALYFVIGVAGHAYVMKFEDQAVTPEIADMAKARITWMLDEVIAALDGASDDRLRAANAIAIEYEWKVSEF